MIHSTTPFFAANKSLCYSSSVNSCLFLLWLKGPKPYTRIEHTMKIRVCSALSFVSWGAWYEVLSRLREDMPNKALNFRVNTPNIIDYRCALCCYTYTTQQPGTYLATQSPCGWQRTHSVTQDFDRNKNQNSLSSNWNIKMCWTVHRFRKENLESFANWHSLFRAGNSFLIRSAPIVSHWDKYCSEVILLVTDGKSKPASKCIRKQWPCRVSGFSQNTLANKLLFLSKAKSNSEHLYGRTQFDDLSISRPQRTGEMPPWFPSVKSWAKMSWEMSVWQHHWQ